MRIRAVIDEDFLSKRANPYKKREKIECAT